jgi:molecular chaperone GrpE
MMKNPFRRRPKPSMTMENDTVKDHTANPEAQPGTTNAAQPTPDSAATGTAEADTASATELRAELDAMRVELQALQDKYVRLYAEYDNFRKRTAKEKLDLMQYGGEGTIKQVLPVLDDFDRAVANNVRATDLQAVKEGFVLIQNKLLHILNGMGLKPMDDPKGQPFDTDRHEAITQMPAPSDELKGCVLEVAEKGYMLHDKVVRYAKVVVGA